MRMDVCSAATSVVMPGRMPGIHAVWAKIKQAWMAGTSSAMTANVACRRHGASDAGNHPRPHLPCPRRRGLGRRHVRRLCLPAPGGRRAGGAAAPEAVAAVLRQIFSLGLGLGPAAARKRLLDAADDLRRLHRRAALHPSDAGDRLADGRAVRLDVPRAVAQVQARGRRAGLAGRRRAAQPHPPDHHGQPAARPDRGRDRRHGAVLGLLSARGKSEALKSSDCIRRLPDACAARRRPP